MSKLPNIPLGVRAASSRSSSVFSKNHARQHGKTRESSNVVQQSSSQSNQYANLPTSTTETSSVGTTVVDALSVEVIEALEQRQKSGEILSPTAILYALSNTLSTNRSLYSINNLQPSPSWHRNGSIAAAATLPSLSSRTIYSLRETYTQTQGQIAIPSSSTFNEQHTVARKKSMRGGKGKHRVSDQSEKVLNNVQQQFTFLLREVEFVDQNRTKTGSNPPFFNGNSPFVEANETSPSHSPSPSPGPSREEENQNVGHRSPFAHVEGPKPKLAVTTSSESNLSSSTTGDGSGGKAAKLQYLASTSSASAPTSSANSLPPQASSSSGSTDQWVKYFKLPRSTKDHEFMFEHGAYGIPKRHPLSAVRSASSTSNAKEGKGERLVPSRDIVPSSKIHAATDMLTAAAEFFTGPQSGPAAQKGEFKPYRGSDALQAALAGGSTAEGYEIQPTPVRSSSSSKETTKTKAHRMAIRGPDGRIIKERLRSVQVGEDAYFLRPDALGVADGVGGWASRPGADPALFSRLLMHFCAVELSRYDGLSAAELAADNGSLLKAWASVDAVEVMHRAWERCVRASRREGILGSSTALIAILRGEELRIANMGDCVLMIIRGGEMLFRSTEQQHSFNFPVQLGMMGDTTDTIKKHVMASQSRERAAGEGEVASGSMEDYDAVEEVNGETTTTTTAANGHGRNRNDTAPPVMPDKQIENEDEPDWDEPRRDAGRWTVRVKAGDIIVVGSDGLMDNLFDEDIIEEVIRFLPANAAKNNNENGEEQESSVKINSANFSPQMVSEALCSRAKAVSEDSRAVSSPFQQRAMEEGLNYVGGKHDDISVLVCLIGERDGLVLDSTGEEAEAKIEEGEGKEVKEEKDQKN